MLKLSEDDSLLVQNLSHAEHFWKESFPVKMSSENASQLFPNTIVEESSRIILLLRSSVSTFSGGRSFFLFFYFILCLKSGGSGVETFAFAFLWFDTIQNLDWYCTDAPPHLSSSRGFHLMFYPLLFPPTFHLPSWDVGLKSWLWCLCFGMKIDWIQYSPNSHTGSH